jgi:hypothetical protein
MRRITECRATAGTARVFWSAMALLCAVARGAEAQCNDPGCATFTVPVGINTTTPLAHLHVFDGVVRVQRPASSAEDAGFLLKHEGPPANAGWWQIGSTPQGHISFFNFGTGTEVLNLFPGGKVAIGTHLAPDTLTVNGPVTVGATRVIDVSGRWVGDPTGLKGPRGEPGLKGEKGLDGGKGQTGEDGDTGERGERGDKGERGLQGARGDPGLAGPAVRTTPRCDKVTTSSANCAAVCPKGVIATVISRMNCRVTAEEPTQCVETACAIPGCSPFNYARCCVCVL